MKYKEIKQNITELAAGQGFYGRLLRRLNEIEETDPEEFNKIVEKLEKQNFNDILDIVFFFER